MSDGRGQRAEVEKVRGWEDKKLGSREVGKLRK